MLFDAVFLDLEPATSSWTDLVGGWRTSHGRVLAVTRDAMWYWPGIQLHANTIRVNGWATSHSCDRRPAAAWSVRGQADLTVGGIQWLPVAAGVCACRHSLNIAMFTYCTSRHHNTPFTHHLRTPTHAHVTRPNRSPNSANVCVIFMIF